MPGNAPRKTHPQDERSVSLRIPYGMHSAIVRQAKAEDVTFSQVVRQFIRIGLRKAKRKPKNGEHKNL